MNKFKTRKLKIVELGNPYIRAVSKPVTNISDKKFQKFIDNLIKTCEKNNGVGIAAPQVSVGKRVFIVWSHKNKRYKKIPKMKPLAVINPKIISMSSQMKKDWEGCLSIPGLRGRVNRPVSIVAEFFGRDGRKVRQKFSGFVARIFLHEFDHLNGVVFIDRADPKDIVTEKEFKRIMKIK